MAFTISDLANGTSTTNNTTLASGATVTANVGDWLVVLVAAANSGTSGAASISGVSDGSGNTYTQRAIINRTDGSVASDGATLGVYTAPVTTLLSSGTVTVSFSANCAEKSVQVYRVSPGVGETVQFVACDATGATENAASHSAPTVSVTSGDTIFGASAIETDDAITGDSDTTNGSWSALISRLADGGLDPSAMVGVSQYKTVTGTGNQSWTVTETFSHSAASTYLVLRPVTAKTIAAGTGAHTFAGTAVAVRQARKVVAGAGAHSFAGTAVTLKRGFRVTAGAGAHSFSNTAITLRHAWKAVAGSGAHSFAGTSVAVKRALKVAAGSGSHTFAGTGVTLTLLTAAKKIAADPGAHTFAGTAITLRHAWKLTAGAGAHSFSGTSVTLKRAWKIGIAAGAHTFAGVDVTLTKATPPPQPAVAHRYAYDPRDEHERERREQKWKDDLRKIIDQSWRIADGEIDPVTFEPIPPPDYSAVIDELKRQAFALDQARAGAFIAEQERLQSDEAIAVLLLAA